MNQKKASLGPSQSNVQGPPIGQNQFSLFLSMFQSFIKSNQKKPQSNARSFFQVQARDRQILFPLPQIPQQGKIVPSELKKWIAHVVKTVISTSFNLYFKNEMTYEQAKIFCSENIFKNIVALNQKYILSPQQFQIMDEHIEGGVIKYLLKKYPFTDSTEINKRLEQTIREVDNIEALENQYFTNSNIKFEYRESGNYNDLIMRMINDLMEIIDRQKKFEKSNYHQFVQTMSSIFQKVQDIDQMIQKEAHSPNQAKDKVSKLATLQQKQRYKSKVKEYTHYLIGRKIPESTPTYSSGQIQNGNLNIQNPTILRILTKWCEQLQQKFPNNYYSVRSESFKTQKGSIKNMLSCMRNALDRSLSNEWKEIQQFIKQIFKNNYEMQSKILENQINLYGYEYIDHLEKVSGKFSYKVVKNLHAYIIAYLNRLIHGLLKVASNVYNEENFYRQDNGWTSPPNLLTFKIGDLMRCKCSSKQSQIIKIYQLIDKMSHDNPQKMKIIRVKNRLKKLTNDILVNVRFNDEITCEIQLAIKSNLSDFIKCSNKWQHYVYELQRSIYGPLTQFCNIWTCLDSRTELYRQLVKEQKMRKQDTDHSCNNIQMFPYKKPFFCSFCGKTYFHNNYLIDHFKCSTCEYMLCAVCSIERLTQDELQQKFMKDKCLQQASKEHITPEKEIPTFGVCIFIQSKQAKYQIFTVIDYQGDKYLLGKKENNRIYQIYRINSNQGIKSFRNKYIIFRAEEEGKYRKIKDKQALYNYLLPLKMKQNYKKYKETISLMDLKISSQECRQILSSGSRLQKENVKAFFLVENSIEELPFDPKDFPKINWLNISSNPIKDLKGLSALQQLKRFTARQCGFQHINNEIYASKSLQNLNLAKNKISSVDEQIVKLDHLQSIQLEYNKITIIHDNLYSCKMIRTLNLSHNQLTSIPDAIGLLNRLQVLNYSFNCLEYISQKVGELQHLYELSLNHNKLLKYIPESLSRLTNIQTFDISYTAVEVLPQVSWPNLKLFNIQQTKIDQISQRYYASTNIETLILNTTNNLNLPQDFSYNKLDEFSVHIILSNQLAVDLQKMSSLKALKLSSDLSKINIDWQAFSLLQVLSLNNCSLAQPPNLAVCKELYKLSLCYNNISDLPSDRFHPSFPLQELRCSHNRLRNLPSWIIQMKKLDYLDVTNNQMQTLFDSKTQEKIHSQRLYWPQLREALLSNNKLSQIPLILCYSPKLKKIKINNNVIKRIRPQIRHLINLNKLELNSNLIDAIPFELSALKIAKLLLQDNQITHIPGFVGNMHLTAFKVDEHKIKIIECFDWIVNAKGQFGSLPVWAKDMQ